MDERLYQAYMLVLLVVCLVLLWVAALDTVADVFGAFDASMADAVFQSASLVPFLVFTLKGIIYLRSCPIRLQYPDIAYVASGQVGSAALVLLDFARTLFANAIIFLGIFYLVGFGIQAKLTQPFDPFAFSAAMTLLTLCSILGCWVLGIWRYGIVSRTWLARKAAPAFVFGAVISVSLGIIAIAFLEGQSPGTLLMASPTLTMSVLSLLLLCGVGLLALLARRLAMVRVIDDNGQFAEMFPLRHMMFNAAQSYADIKRRKKLARRGAQIFIPIGSGFAAFMSRDLLSLLRQYEGLPVLLMWGAFAAPLLVLLMAGMLDPFFWVVALQVLVVFPKGVWESTRIYRSDSKNRMIRHHLPYNPLSLLVRDTLPSFALIAVVSVIAILASSSLGIDLLWGALMCVLVNIILTLCGGLNEVRLFNLQRHISYEVAVIIALVVLGIISLYGSWFALVASSLLIIFVYGAMIKAGSESD